MKKVTLEEFSKEPMKFLPAPEEGLEINILNMFKMYCYPIEKGEVNDKANFLANLVVNKLEPKLINMKNFPISTLVTKPRVMDQYNLLMDIDEPSTEDADIRCWVTNIETDKSGVFYLSINNYRKVKDDSRFKIRTSIPQSV